MLAAVAPAAAYLFLPGGVAPISYGVMALYLAYAVVVALRGRTHTGMVGLLALFGDTLFFLVVASYGADRMLWLASAFYLFLLGEALAFYNTVEVVVVVAVCAVFCAVLPYGALPLERTVAVAGVLACAFAVNKRRRDLEIAQLREKLREAEKAAGKARELERVRIASDFHDGPLQRDRKSVV